MAQTKALLVAAVAPTVSAQIFGDGKVSFLYMALLICVPMALGTVFFIVCGKLCKSEQEKLQENIIQGVPVVVFIEEGRETMSSTDEAANYVTGMTPVAQPVYDFEITQGAAPQTTSASVPPSCSAA
ncbi:hypothetical protein ACHHYP_15561 [Achlya hypogyna]|uniref:Secreted protein n=1 Tax=Achlya hypogyna TaxID=1202772 RepID=A0A1V9YAP6_ACHHY|nr:hypothetical protein ACHHYP_15561 [Achlya hypogyna]